MFHWLYKTLPVNTFYVLLMEILCLKKACDIYTRLYLYTWVYFSRRRCDQLKGGWTQAERDVIIKRFRWNKSLHFRGGVDKWKQRKWVAVFLKNWYCHPHTLLSPPCSKVTESNIKIVKLNPRTTEELSIYINFFLISSYSAF